MAVAVTLLLRPFVLALVGSIVIQFVTLLLLRDVLTQTVLLLIFGTLGLSLRLRWSLKRLGGIADITATTYLVAAIHKLNEGFVDASTSCANHAWRQIDNRWSNLLPDVGDAFLPSLVLLVELCLAMLLFFRKRHYWILGVAFHLPLMVTLAPAFGAVMFCGALASLDRRAVFHLRQMLVRYPHYLIVFSAAVIGIESTIGTTQIALNQTLQVGLYLALGFVAYRSMSGKPCGRQRLSLVVPLWFAFCLTPYFGLQYQHTAAMLSNLRIDLDCHNSLLFPASWVGDDPYVRILSAQFGEANWSERQRIVREGLWNETALFTMRKNWCVPRARPMKFTVLYHGHTYEIDDLCRADSLDFIPHHFHYLKGFQRFQKNLTQGCHQACIH